MKVRTMPENGTPLERRPQYVPVAVWRFYRELEDKELLNARDRALITRLFGSDMELTWRNLARQVETENPEYINISPNRVREYLQIAEDLDCTEREAIAEQDWRHLFDNLLNARLSFDAGARKGMKRARELLSEISDTSNALSGLLAEYCELCNEHELSAPEEFNFLLKWIHNTARNGDPGPVFRMWTVKRFGFPGPGAIEPKYLPAPASMIETLGQAAADHAPECYNETSTHVDDPKHSTVTAWVRHFDARWKDWQEPYIMAARFEISNTDLARIASAVLNMDVRREAVSRARSRSRSRSRAKD